jgi:uncharacterized protein YeaO (DUF488 family)
VPKENTRNNFDAMESRIARLEAWIPMLSLPNGLRAEIDDDPVEWYEKNARYREDLLGPPPRRSEIKS